VNLAPWNVDGHNLTRDKGILHVDGQELIFYHFSGLRRDPDGGWWSFYPHGHRQPDVVRDAIYGPYLAAVESERDRILRMCGVEGTGSVRQDLTLVPNAVRFEATIV
jgi:hypothetical protein